MKPTLKMLHRFEQPPAAATVRDAETSAVERLIERKQQVERALEQTRDQLENGEIAQALDQRLRELVRSPVTRPKIGADRAVVVRVVGIAAATEERVAPRFPLPGLEVEIRFRFRLFQPRTVILDTTDPSGVAVLQIPRGRTGPFTVRVLGPDRKTVVRRPGSKTSSNQPTVLLEIAESPALAPAFARGRVWDDAAEQAKARAGELEDRLHTALSNQEAILADALVKLEDAIAAQS